MKQILDVVCAYLMMDDNGLLCNVYNTTELGEEDVTKLFVMDQDMFPGWLEEHQNALETMSDFLSIFRPSFSDTAAHGVFP